MFLDIISNRVKTIIEAKNISRFELLISRKKHNLEVKIAYFAKNLDKLVLVNFFGERSIYKYFMNTFLFRVN